MAKNYQGKLIFLEHREVKYLVDLFGFLEGDCSTVLLSPPSPSPTSASSTPSIDNGEFSANRVGRSEH